MSPIVRMGPVCGRCSVRPAGPDGVCRACELLLAAFGRTWAGPERDVSFEVELRRWLEAA